MAYGQQYGQPNLQAIFASVDKDRSGKITSDELQKALSNGTWKPFNPETCRMMIGMFDRDGDGAINFPEFENELRNALTQFGYRLSEQFYNILMMKFDRSQTGNINFDDFIQLCVVLQTLTAAFRDKDHDRDGVITVQYEEFLTMGAGVIVSFLKK